MSYALVRHYHWFMQEFKSSFQNYWCWNMFHIRVVTDESKQFSIQYTCMLAQITGISHDPWTWYIESCNVGMQGKNTVQNRIYLCSGVDYIYMSHCDTMRCNNMNPTHRKYAPKLIVSAFVYVTNWNVMVCICSYDWIMVEWNEHEAVTCLHDGGYRNKTKIHSFHQI